MIPVLYAKLNRPVAPYDWAIANKDSDLIEMNPDYKEAANNPPAITDFVYPIANGTAPTAPILPTSERQSNSYYA